MKTVCCAVAILFVICSIEAFAQEEAKPVIITLLPDSALGHFDYSPLYCHVVSITSRFSGDPTKGALETLQEEIIDICKKQKFDVFFLQQIVFAKPFDEGKLIAYGSFLRRKSK